MLFLERTSRKAYRVQEVHEYDHSSVPEVSNVQLLTGDAWFVARFSIPGTGEHRKARCSLVTRVGSLRAPSLRGGAQQVSGDMESWPFSARGLDNEARESPRQPITRLCRGRRLGRFGHRPRRQIWSRQAPTISPPEEAHRSCGPDHGLSYAMASGRSLQRILTISYACIGRLNPFRVSAPISTASTIDSTSAKTRWLTTIWLDLA